VPAYQENFFEQLVDPFTFASNDTFAQRFLTLHPSSSSPVATLGENSSTVLLFMGNEADIVALWNASGFVTGVLAEKLDATPVFLEHRYFGTSMPFGDASLTPKGLVQLSMDRALADAARFIDEVLPTGARVITVGGSYGGTLAALMRVRYPHLVTAALASSPGLNIGKDSQPFSALDNLGRIFGTAGGDACTSSLGDAFAAFETTPLSTLSTLFNTCEPVTNPLALSSSVLTTLWDVALADYPYPTNFVGPMRVAWPVNATCDALATPPPPASLSLSHPTTATDNSTALAALSRALWNITWTGDCLNLTAPAASPVLIAFGYIYCSDFYYPLASRGDIFPPASTADSTWSAHLASCHAAYGPTMSPRPAAFAREFGQINDAAGGISNILHTRGTLDICFHMGHNTSLPGQPLLTIPAAAHHADLRAPTSLDPPSVVAARLREIEILQSFLA
jgi:pimeloyl-ACP methyl ester carboxylesterase